MEDVSAPGVSREVGDVALPLLWKAVVEPKQNGQMLVKLRTCLKELKFLKYDGADNGAQAL